MGMRGTNKNDKKKVGWKKIMNDKSERERERREYRNVNKKEETN